MGACGALRRPFSTNNNGASNDAAKDANNSGANNICAKDANNIYANNAIDASDANSAIDASDTNKLFRPRL